MKANPPRQSFIRIVGLRLVAAHRDESASIAVTWAVLITTLVYKSLSWENFLRACAKACKTSGVMLLLIGVPAAFGYFMALYEGRSAPAR